MKEGDGTSDHAFWNAEVREHFTRGLLDYQPTASVEGHVIVAEGTNLLLPSLFCAPITGE